MKYVQCPIDITISTKIEFQRRATKKIFRAPEISFILGVYRYLQLDTLYLFTFCIIDDLTHLIFQIIYIFEYHGQRLYR